MTDLAAELAGIHDTLQAPGRRRPAAHEPQSSVEIARNSKGARWTVKVYAHGPVEASTLAQGLHDQLPTAMPAQSGSVIYDQHHRR